LILLGFVLVCPRGVEAQVGVSLEDREAEYRVAQLTHETAVQALGVAERNWDRAVQAAEAARVAGDDERRARAMADAQRQVGPLESAQRRVETTGAALAEAREALLEAIDQRLDSLVAELEGTSDQGEREALGITIRDLNIRYYELEQEDESPQVPQFTSLPEIQFDPGDGPEEWRLKADLADRHAARYEAFLGEIDGEVDDLRRRQRRERSILDHLASIERFGDIRLPVVTSTRRIDPVTGEVLPDSLATEERPLTLEERIEQLLLLRDQVETQLEQVRIRARVFRQRIGGVRTW
jgi:hypothetical protein